MKKIILVIISSFFVLFLVAMLGASFIVKSLNIDEAVKNTAGKYLGREVSFSNIQVNLIPSLSVSLENVAIAESLVFNDKTVVEADLVRLKLRLIPLVMKKVIIDELVFKGLKGYFRQKDVSTNIEELLIDQAKSSRLHQTEKKQIVLNGKQKETGLTSISFEISKLSLEKSSFTFEKYDENNNLILCENVKDIEGSIKNISFFKPIKYEFEGSVFGAGHVNAQGEVSLRDINNLLESGFSSEIECSLGSLTRLKTFFNFEIPEEILAAEMSAKVFLKKQQDEKKVDSTGTLEIKNRSAKKGNLFSDVKIPFEFYFDLPVKNFSVKRVALMTSKSSLDVEGMFSVKENIFDIRLKSNYFDSDELKPFLKKFRLDEIKVKDSLTFDLMFKGDTFSQTIKGYFGLTKSEIAYSNLFFKPGNLQFDIQYDFSTSSFFKEISGAFDVNLGQMNLKGEVVNFSLEKYEGEIGFLTNRFSAAELAGQFPCCSGLAVEGFAKVSLSTDGKLTDIKKLKYSCGATLVDFGVKDLKKSINILQHINAYTVLDNNKFEIKELDGYVLRSPVKADLTVSDIFGDPKFLYELYSEKLDLDYFCEYFQNDDLGDLNKSDTKKDTAVLKTIEIEKKEHDGVSSSETVNLDKSLNQNAIAEPVDVLNKILGEGSFYCKEAVFRNKIFQEMQGSAGFEAGSVVIESLQAQGLGGQILLKGKANISEVMPPFNIVFSADDLDVESTYNFINGGISPQFARGKISSEAIFSGKGYKLSDLQDYLSAKGKIEVVDGELLKIDIFKALSTVKQFFGLQQKAYGGTKFKSISTEFSINEGKVLAQDVQVESDDFTIKANGEVSLKGDLLFDLSVALAPELSDKVIPGIDDHELVSIPVRISGTVWKPKYSVTGAVVRRIVTDIVQRGLNDLLKVVNKVQPAAKTEDAGTSTDDGSSVYDSGSEASAEDVLENVISKGLSALLGSGKKEDL